MTEEQKKIAREWLHSGFGCDCSYTLYRYASGFMDDVVTASEPAPKTVEDFRRCRIMLEFCPFLIRTIPRVGYASKAWAEFASFWPDLTSVHDSEDPPWRVRCGEAPKLKAMIDYINERTKA